MAKQEGQETVAKRAPQCSQWVASLAATAPHIGQLRVSACMGHDPKRFREKGQRDTHEVF
jgi:hypothetical protein